MYDCYGFVNFQHQDQCEKALRKILRLVLIISHRASPRRTIIVIFHKMWEFCRWFGLSSFGISPAGTDWI